MILAVLAILAILILVFVSILTTVPRESMSAIFGGFGDSEECITSPFCGEQIPRDFVPILKEITASSISEVPKLLEDIARAPPFQNSPQLLNPVLSYGQRKLLIEEVGFLTRYGHLSNKVVYVGAAPGFHISFLTRLFPKHRFTLYDTGSFFMRGIKSSNIKVRGRYFTEDDAKALNGQDVLFISDIRTGVTNVEAATKVAGDMIRQKAWVIAANPAATSLKFRLPWTPGTTQYFKGTLRVQTWAPRSTNETRLEFVKVPTQISWDHSDYDQRLHYLNEGLRQWAFFDGELPEVPGVDHCFDCASEIATWNAFIDKGLGVKPLDNVAALMNAATKSLNQRLNIAPHGKDPEIPMVEKRERLINECRSGQFPCHVLALAKVKRRKAFEKRRKRKGQN